MAEDDTQQSVQELGLATAKSGTVFVFSKVAGAAVTLMLLVFLTRFLRPADYGIYTLAVAFATLLGTGGNFGIGTALRKKLPEEKAEKERRLGIISNAYAVSTLIALAISIAGISLSGTIATYVYGNPSMTMPLVVASVIVLLTVLFNITVAVLVGLDMISESAVSNVAYTVIQLFMTVVLVTLGYGVLGAMAGLAAGLLIGFVIAFAYVALRGYARTVMPSWKTARELTRFSAPVVVANIVASGTTSFAIAFLGVFAGVAMVGSFGAAYKLGRIVELVLTSTTFVLLPAFSKMFASEHLARRVSSIYGSSVYYMLLLLLPVLAWMVGAATPLTRLLFSGAYASAPFYFAVIAIGTAVGIIGSFAATLIIGHGDTRRFMRYQVIVVVMELAMLFAFVPLYKATGVLVALFIIAPVFFDVLYLHALREQFGLKLDSKRLAAVAGAAVIAGLAMLSIVLFMHGRYLSIAVAAVVDVLLYPPLVALFRGANRRSTEFIRTIARKFGPLYSPIDILMRYAELFMSKEAQKPTK
jgi:O-antigen/teichoic acid export membrane protein